MYMLSMLLQNAYSLALAQSYIFHDVILIKLFLYYPIAQYR